MSRQVQSRMGDQVRTWPWMDFPSVPAPIPQPLSPAPSDGVTLASSSTLRGPQALAHCFGLQLRFGICAPSHVQPEKSWRQVLQRSIYLRVILALCGE